MIEQLIKEAHEGYTARAAPLFDDAVPGWRARGQPLLRSSPKPLFRTRKGHVFPQTGGKVAPDQSSDDASVPGVASDTSSDSDSGSGSDESGTEDSGETSYGSFSDEEGGSGGVGVRRAGDAAGEGEAPSGASSQADDSGS